MIEFSKISKIHGYGANQVTALRDVSLRVTKGEFVALVGPSGSGKSTMMNIMGLLDRPTAGEIKLADQRTKNLSVRDLALARGRTIGFVFQSFHLLPRLTAWQNVALPLRYQSVCRSEREVRARRMLARFGLENRASHRPDELSGGQRQRVALARALINEPPIILADEPTGNLDSKSAEEALELLADLNRSDALATIVMVTHDPRMAQRCSRIVELLDGRVTADR